MIALSKISTRELLKELRSRRSFGIGEEVSGCKPTFIKRGNVAFRLVEGGNTDVAVATTAELVAELDTRPHVPGKPEGKTLRRLMAKTGWTEEQLRAHPRFGMELADAQHPNRQKISPSWARQLKSHYGSRFGSKFKVVKR